MEKEFTLVKCN